MATVKLTAIGVAVPIPAFGDDSLTLRITHHAIPGTPANRAGMVAVTVNTGGDPDTAIPSTDPNTHILPPNGDSSIFVEDTPSGQWEVIATLLRGQEAFIEFEEF